MSQRIAVFADVNNLYHGARKRFRGRLNYKMWLEELVKSHGVIQKAYAYGISEEEDDTVGGFRTFLRCIGFECRWEATDYNWNVGIAMDVMRQLDKVDTIVFGSADPFLSPAVEYVKDYGLKSYVYGFTISSEMKRAADRYFEIPETMMVQSNEGASISK